MAIQFNELIAATRAYAESERGRQQPTERISSADFKNIMEKSVALGGNTNENIIKIYDEMKKQTSLFMASKQDKTAAAEEKQEAAKVEEDQTNVLKQIADNTDPKKQIQTQKDGKGLGAVVTGITVALAALSGTIAGYVKSIKVLLDVFTPDFIKSKLAKSLVAVQETLVEFGTKLKTILSNGIDKVSGFLTQGLSKLKLLLTFDEASAFGKFIAGFKDGFAKIITPFKEAFSTIKNLLGGATKGIEFVGDITKTISTTIGNVGKWMGKIATLFKSVFTIVSKLATPLFVIMTLWDTVKNVLKRYESDGIVGAFVGIFEGLLKSIVAAPLDLVKDITSWVLDKLGFENASKFLDSFSFEYIVKDFFDAILSPVETIKEIFNKVPGLVDEFIVKPLEDAFAPIANFFSDIKDSVVGFFEAVEIPKIGFTIPVIDKEVSIGPFYPFKRQKRETETAAAGTVVTAQAPGFSQNMVMAQQDVVAKDAITSRPATANAQLSPMAQTYIDSVATGKMTPDQAIESVKKFTDNGKVNGGQKLVDTVTNAVRPLGATTVAPDTSAARVAPASPSAANIVYGASAENATTAAMGGVGTTNNVVAPTTVNNTTNQLGGYKPDVRNQDSSFKRMLDSRYVPV